MDSGHQALDDLEVVVDDLGDGGQAVGGAGCVRDDVHGCLDVKTNILGLTEFFWRIEQLLYTSIASLMYC